VSEIDINGFGTATDTTWMSPEHLELVRAHVPIVYVEAISRLIVSGRVKFGERIRDALMRHCEKDLGPMALPRIPASPSPFTVAEYFPHPDISGFHDPRQHAVSLAYVVPVDGDCSPTQEALDLSWFTPAEVVSAAVIGQMTGGQDRLLRLALAHVGQLP
jgi:hypothetical protein